MAFIAAAATTAMDDTFSSPELTSLSVVAGQRRPPPAAAELVAKRRRSSLSRRRSSEDREAVLESFRQLMTGESRWFASLKAKAPERFDLAGIALETMRLSGELLFMAHGLKPAVLFANLTADEAFDYINNILVPSGLLEAAPISSSFSQPEPPKETILDSPRLVHLTGAFYALRLGAVKSPQSDMTGLVIVFHRPLASLAAPGTLRTLLQAPDAAPDVAPATVSELHMATLLDYPVALPEEPIEADATDATSDEVEESPARTSRKRVRLMTSKYADVPTLEIAYTVRHFQGAPFVVLTSYGAPQSTLPAVRRHFARYQMELQDILHIQLVMIPL